MKTQKEKIKEWFYLFKHGHPVLIKEEADIICQVRFNKHLAWANDEDIKTLIRHKIKVMYKQKFPNAKRFRITNVNNKSVI